MLLKTSNKYANQSLQLPVVGEVKLDENASFDCPKELVDKFIHAMRGSTEFSPLVKKQPKPVVQVTDAELAAAPPVKEEEEQVADPEAMKAAIEDASLEELIDLAALVPGVKKKDIKNMDEAALKELLLSKI